MRLIDLDKIDVFHQKDEDVVFDIIHATPIDAIPIDYINDWMDKNSHGYTSYMMPIVDLVEDWRKENE